MSYRTWSLDSIPYDVLYQIVANLDCDDFVNLSRVNRSLHAVMNDNEAMAKRALEVIFFFFFWPTPLGEIPLPVVVVGVDADLIF